MEVAKQAALYARDRAPIWSLESVAGLAAIGSFYVGEFGALRTVLQVGAMLCVSILFAQQFSSRHTRRGPQGGQGFVGFLLLLAFSGAFLSFAFSLLRDLSTRDVGLFVLQLMIAAMIVLSARSSRIAFAVGAWAVPFALADAIANFAGVMGLLDIQAPARMIDGEVVYAYPGLSGSTLGGGFVAFVAICKLAHDAVHRRVRIGLALLAIVAILVSLHLIEARRYTGLTLTALSLVAGWRFFSRIGLQWVVLAVAGSFLALTFLAGAGDVSNLLRADLLMSGISRALENPILGMGPSYQDLEGLNATFEDLTYAGVTESQLLDFAISYGILSCFAFAIAVMVALAAQQQKRSSFPTVVLTCLMAELFFGGSLTSVPGVFLFFGCLGECLKLRSRPRETSKVTSLAP